MAVAAVEAVWRPSRDPRSSRSIDPVAQSAGFFAVQACVPALTRFRRHLERPGLASPVLRRSSSSSAACWVRGDALAGSQVAELVARSRRPGRRSSAAPAAVHALLPVEAVDLLQLAATSFLIQSSRLDTPQAVDALFGSPYGAVAGTDRASPVPADRARGRPSASREEVGLASVWSIAVASPRRGGGLELVASRPITCSSIKAEPIHQRAPWLVRQGPRLAVYAQVIPPAPWSQRSPATLGHSQHQHVKIDRRAN